LVLKNALNAEFWIKVKQQAKVWRVGAFPGLAVVSCVVIARLTGSSFGMDGFRQLSAATPAEAEDTQVVIIGIDENDIKAVGDYPVPNRDLAKMLRILQSYKPRAIGLDMFRDLTADPGYAELAKILQTLPILLLLKWL